MEVGGISGLTGVLPQTVLGGFDKIGTGIFHKGAGKTMTTDRVLHISDIQTSDVLYHDEGAKDRCYKVCAERNIDCLPSLDDPYALYIRDDTLQKFKPERLVEDRRVGADVDIFDPQILEKFRLNPLLLVYQGRDLAGVLHFTDYNKPVVGAFLFERLFEYENLLRLLLIRSGFKNVDMVAYLSEKKTRDADPDLYDRKINAYFKFGSQKKLPQFEVFCLVDLIGLVTQKHILKLTDKSKLRNMVMRVNEPLNPEEPGVENFIYEFETFESYFRWSQELLMDIKRVANRLAII
jgi:hypothetical protein